jgi:hypothetical protein
MQNQTGEQIQAFWGGRNNIVTRVGTKKMQALFKIYVSSLAVRRFPNFWESCGRRRGRFPIFGNLADGGADVSQFLGSLRTVVGTFPNFGESCGRRWGRFPIFGNLADSGGDVSQFWGNSERQWEGSSNKDTNTKTGRISPSEHKLGAGTVAGYAKTH